MLVSRLGLSLLVNVWWKMLVLEAWIVTFGEVLEAWVLTFGERLAENARFGSLDSHFW